MARRTIGIGLAVIGLIIAALGIATGTVWAPEPTIVAKASLKTPGAVVVSAPGALQLVDQNVTISASGNPEAPVLVAIGRAEDVNAWAAGVAHTTVTGLSRWDKLSTSSEKGDEAAVNPAGSDLWLKEATGVGKASLKWNVKDGGPFAVLIASDGTQPAPSVVTFTWPNDTSTPLMVPGIIVGLLLLSLGLYLALKRKNVDKDEKQTQRAAEAKARRLSKKEAGSADQEDVDGGDPGDPILPELIPADGAGISISALGQPLFQEPEHYSSLPPELANLDEEVDEAPSVFARPTGPVPMSRKARRRAETGQTTPIEEPLLTVGESTEMDAHRSELNPIVTSSPSALDAAISSSPNVFDSIVPPLPASLDSVISSSPNVLDAIVSSSPSALEAVSSQEHLDPMISSSPQAFDPVVTSSPDIFGTGEFAGQGVTATPDYRSPAATGGYVPETPIFPDDKPEPLPPFGSLESRGNADPEGRADLVADSWRTFAPSTETGDQEHASHGGENIESGYFSSGQSHPSYGEDSTVAPPAPTSPSVMPSPTAGLTPAELAARLGGRSRREVRNDPPAASTGATDPAAVTSPVERAPQWESSSPTFGQDPLPAVPSVEPIIPLPPASSYADSQLFSQTAQRDTPSSLVPDIPQVSTPNLPPMPSQTEAPLAQSPSLGKTDESESATSQSSSSQEPASSPIGGEGNTKLSGLRSRLRRSRGMTPPTTLPASESASPATATPPSHAQYGVDSHAENSDGPAAFEVPQGGSTTRGDSWRRAWGVDSSDVSFTSNSDSTEDDEL